MHRCRLPRPGRLRRHSASDNMGSKSGVKPETAADNDFADCQDQAPKRDKTRMPDRLLHYASSARLAARRDSSDEADDMPASNRGLAEQISPAACRRATGRSPSACWRRGSARRTTAMDFTLSGEQAGDPATGRGGSAMPRVVARYGLEKDAPRFSARVPRAMAQDGLSSASPCRRKEIWRLPGSRRVTRRRCAAVQAVGRVGRPASPAPRRSTVKIFASTPS